MTKRSRRGGASARERRPRPAEERAPAGRVSRPAASDDQGRRVEGRRAVVELLRAGKRRVRTVWVSGDGLDDVVELAHSAGAEVQRVDVAEVSRRARTDAPQGVVAVADPVEPSDLDDLLAHPAAFLVALDGVTDPQNLGAVIRSAEIFGATGIVLPRHRSAQLGPAVVKAAAGAVEHVPVATVSGVPAALAQATRAGVWTVGLEAGAGSSIYDLGVTDRPVVLVLGSEGRGLSRLARERCEVLAHIPLYGAIESLNVAAAAAIACCEVARTRHG